MPLTPSNRSQNTAQVSFDKNNDASMIAHGISVDTKGPILKLSWTLPLDEEAEDTDERNFTLDRMYNVDCDRTVPMNEQHQLCAGIDAVVTNEKDISSICHEIDDISPLALAYKRRMALLKKQKTPSQQREGFGLIIFRAFIATIFTTCMEPLTSQRQRSSSPSTDSRITEPVHELFDNHEQNILQIYISAVISKIFLMILKPLYSSINPRKPG